MSLNYNRRLQNVRSRKFDAENNIDLTAKDFSLSYLPENIKYLLEAMRPISSSYNAKTILAVENVKNHLERDLQLRFNRAYARQGSVETNTNIKVHSDVDLLAIIDSYVYSEPGINDSLYTLSNPDNDIRDLRKQSENILKNQYDEVDCSGEKCVTIYNKNLRRKVDVVFGYWYDTQNYRNTRNNYYRGVKLGSSSAAPDFPFAHIVEVNDKGGFTLGGSRMGIRLLKNLRADADIELSVAKSFQLTTVVHAIDNSLLTYRSGGEIDVPIAVSGKLGEIIGNPSYRKSIKSPNGRENPLADDKIVRDLQILKMDLDELIVDCRNEFNNNSGFRNAVKNYN